MLRALHSGSRHILRQRDISFALGPVRHISSAANITHQVTNQSPEFVDNNLFANDAVLHRCLARSGHVDSESAHAALFRAGAVAGSRESVEHARLANLYTPVLHTHDRWGRHVDRVEFHPSYHALMRIGMQAGVHLHPQLARAEHKSMSTRCAQLYLHNQMEQGTSCPLTMTFAAAPVLAQSNCGALGEVYQRGISSLEYDPTDAPADAKRSITLGMAMTEKQGGSDVRANRTVATPISSSVYSLRGHKWFCSAPMSDAFFTLAYISGEEEKSGGELSCFLVPRWLPDGQRNSGFQVKRLKSKLGNRSNASSEIEYHDAWAQLVGEPGRGIRAIMDMVAHTRLDCAVAGAAQMRQALSLAIHHCSYREAFGKRLRDQPLMSNVLADLCVESEAATVLAFRIARAFERAHCDEHERALARIGTAVAKYFVCKQVPQYVYEAMECLGGNGYVEDSPTARLFRESPLNAIWEGSGNVISLDVLRAMGREPAALDALLTELKQATGMHPSLDVHIARVLTLAQQPVEQLVVSARLLVDQLAIGLQASLLLREASPLVAELFCLSRLEPLHCSRNYGRLPVEMHTRFEEVIASALPSE
mmetsp:Transcript_39462/g.99472  ORF Transcript_39462/g.99472 Transcript_39462/m.99472 type:complete len:593 (-) Transcript_39462:41-1819(-)